ncbi:uncharacterized protein LOC135943431 isoform X2 [Cloeon dipterum]|uniref:uncharacterized protein LOC135943431 isoform X2 n=1 Tax=Cloeon dipterum TaxID=197152 RepID=UPI00322014F3
MLTARAAFPRLLRWSSSLAYNPKKFNGIYDPKTHIVRSPYQGTLPAINACDYVWRDYKKHESELALTCAISGKSLTFGQTHGAFDRLSVNLPAKFGLRQGDVVGLVLPNMPEFAIVFYGCLAAGLVVSPANPIYTSDELLKQFTDAKVSLVVTTPELADRVREALSRMPGGGAPVVLTGQAPPAAGAKDTFLLDELITQQIKGAERLPKPDPQCLAVLPYSSGTTGMPKGVVISHRNLVAGLSIGDHPDAVTSGVEDGRKNSTLAVIPFYHIYGSVIILGCCIGRGYRVITLPRFDPTTYSQAFEKYKPTHLFLVPPLVHFMARSPSISREAMQNIKLTVSGAAPLTKQIMDEFVAKLGPTSIFKTGYGMTESSCLLTVMPEIMPTCKAKSLGPPGVFTEFKIADNEGNALPQGQVGELCARGPQIISGYLNNEKVTKETITEDGWLKTGDVAFFDEYGHVNIVDRVKELIKVKGYQVSPTEIESILIQLEGVADVAVIGLPDEKNGELPKAFIVKKPGAQITEQTVMDFLNPKVAEFKKLRGGVQFLEAIPRSAAGKILRKDLKSSA